MARPHRSRGGRTTPEGIRITKVGLWYVLLTVLAAIAATNTGNNAIYLVVSVMLAALVVSGVVSRQNVRGLDAELEIAADVFAKSPFTLEFKLTNRSRWMPRWLLLVAASRGGTPRLVPYLPRRGVGSGRLELLLGSRGRQAIPALHVSSLFPFGFFRKGVRYQLDRELLVFPELYPAATVEVEQAGRFGERPVSRAGRGHDLYALRGFRQGDDPRGIHWKQTARTGAIVYMEREAEESRRLSILFDNGVGLLEGEQDLARFERLVSEAATTAVDYLGRGFEVELVTRDLALPFAAGRRQRLAILEHLALIAPVGACAEALRSRDPGAPQVRIRQAQGPWRESTEEEHLAAARLGRRPAAEGRR